MTSLAWYGGEIGKRTEPLSGLVPQISVIVGKCAGGAVYAPINTDVVVATEEAYMFVTGPDVIKAVTGEEVSLEELGSARKQAEYGNVHHIAPDEKAAFDWVRQYLSYMPSNAQEKPPRSSIRVSNRRSLPTISNSTRSCPTPTTPATTCTTCC